MVKIKIKKNLVQRKITWEQLAPIGNLVMFLIPKRKRKKNLL